MFSAISINEINKKDEENYSSKNLFSELQTTLQLQTTLALLASSSANDSDATTMLLDSTAANVSQATVPTPTPASSTLREGADNRDSASSAEEVNQGEHFLTT